MRVLLITGSYPPMKCGVGDYSRHLANSLAADPDTVVGVLTSAFCDEGVTHGRIDVFPIIRTWRASEICKVIRIIQRWRPNIVHIQYPTQGYGNGLLPWLLPMIVFLMGKKVVQTWHEGYRTGQAPGLALKALVPGGLVVVRPGYKESLHPSLRWAFWKKKCVFIRNVSVIPRSDISDEERNALRRHYLQRQTRLVVFFGFVYPHKGVDLLFRIADPETDHIVIAGEIREKDEYGDLLFKLASTGPWIDKVTITGFLPSGQVAPLLAAADAVVLPFRLGGGQWNTSIHAAVLQGTFVITTSLSEGGYDIRNNVYYARPGAIEEMREALDAYAGKRRPYNADTGGDEWRQVATEHRHLYQAILSE